MKKMEQVAIATENPEKLIEALITAGVTSENWVRDTVTAEGTVFGEETVNVANLYFNYDLGFELEILKYREGKNWHEKRKPVDGSNFLSHMGRHVDSLEMARIKKDMELKGIGIAQEVYTLNHENPAIKGKRKYHYVVFDSRGVLGFDLKLIERIYE